MIHLNMEKRYKKIMDSISRKGLDTIIVSSPENVFYSTGAYIGTQKRHPERLEICILSINFKPIFIVCGVEETLVRKESWVKDIRPYIEFGESPIKILADILYEKKLDNGKIGIEMNSPWSAYSFINELLRLMPKTKFVECGDIFENIRKLKEPEEIEILSGAAKATRKSVEAGFLNAKIGSSERNVANQMKTNLNNQGADEIYFMLLGTGERSVITNPTPSDKVIEKGDIIRADLGGLFSGYYSDLARTAVAGSPSKTQIDIYKKMMDVHKEIISKMKCGVRMCDIYNKCKKLFEERGINYTFTHLGHGVGVSSHDQPFITPINGEVLEEDMVLDIEPVIEYEGYGYHVEDLIAITKNNSPRILTGSKMDDKIIIVN